MGNLLREIESYGKFISSCHNCLIFLEEFFIKQIHLKKCMKHYFLAVFAGFTFLHFLHWTQRFDTYSNFFNFKLNGIDSNLRVQKTSVARLRLNNVYYPEILKYLWEYFLSDECYSLKISSDTIANVLTKINYNVLAHIWMINSLWFYNATENS